MINPALSVKQRIHGKGKGKVKEHSEEDIPEIYHDFMECYGWIPLTDFLNIPLPVFFEMNKYVQKNKKIKYENNIALKVCAKALGYKGFD